MASFLSTLSVPPGSTFAAPASQPLVVIPGTLQALRLYVPPGPRGEVYLRLIYGGVQIAPARIGTWWRPDAITITHPLDVPVAKGDLFFYLEGASPTANFTHSVDFELIVSPLQSGAPSPAPVSLLERFAGLFGQ